MTFLEAIARCRDDERYLIRYTNPSSWGINPSFRYYNAPGQLTTDDINLAYRYNRTELEEVEARADANTSVLLIEGGCDSVHPIIVRLRQAKLSKLTNTLAKPFTDISYEKDVTT